MRDPSYLLMDAVHGCFSGLIREASATSSSGRSTASLAKVVPFFLVKFDWVHHKLSHLIWWCNVAIQTRRADKHCMSFEERVGVGHAHWRDTQAKDEKPHDPHGAVERGSAEFHCALLKIQGRGHGVNKSRSTILL